MSLSFLIGELSNSISQLCHGMSQLTAGWLYIRWIAGVILALIDDDISPFEEFPILWMIERGCLSGINRQGINHRPPIHQITQTSAITRHTNKTRASQPDYYHVPQLAQQPTFLERSWSLTRDKAQRNMWHFILIQEIFSIWMSPPSNQYKRRED